MLAWLSVWNEVQMICMWSNWCHCHPIISCSIKIQIGSTFLVPAYPGCPGHEAIKQMSVCLYVTRYSNPATWSLTLPQTVDRSSLMHCSLWWKQSQLMRIHQMIAAETKLQSVILCCGENHTFDLAVNWSHGNRVPVSQLSAQWLLRILMTTLIITTTTITTRLILSVVV